jgi:hypothetical protein
VKSGLAEVNSAIFTAAMEGALATAKMRLHDARREMIAAQAELKKSSDAFNGDKATVWQVRKFYLSDPAPARRKCHQIDGRPYRIDCALT